MLSPINTTLSEYNFGDVIESEDDEMGFIVGGGFSRLEKNVALVYGTSDVDKVDWFSMMIERQRERRFA